MDYFSSFIHSMLSIKHNMTNGSTSYSPNQDTIVNIVSLLLIDSKAITILQNGYTDKIHDFKKYACK